MSAKLKALAAAKKERAAAPRPPAAKSYVESVNRRWAPENATEADEEHPEESYPQERVSEEEPADQPSLSEQPAFQVQAEFQEPAAQDVPDRRHRCGLLKSFVKNSMARAIAEDAGPYGFIKFIPNSFLTEADYDRFCELWGENPNDKIVLAYHSTGHSRDPSVPHKIQHGKQFRVGTAENYGKGVYLGSNVRTAVEFANRKPDIMVALVIAKTNFLIDQKESEDKLKKERPRRFIVANEPSMVLPVGVLTVQAIDPQRRDRRDFGETSLNGYWVEGTPSHAATTALGGTKPRASRAPRRLRTAGSRLQRTARGRPSSGTARRRASRSRPGRSSASAKRRRPR